MPVPTDLTGQRFGRLTVIGAAAPYIVPLRGWQQRKWLCQCDCGSEPKSIHERALIHGLTKSCGCLRKERGHRTHGQSGSPEYQVWRRMKDRCLNPKHQS
jgi:hypothetical protein